MGFGILVSLGGAVVLEPIPKSYQGPSVLSTGLHQGHKVEPHRGQVTEGEG